MDQSCAWCQRSTFPSRSDNRNNITLPTFLYVSNIDLGSARKFGTTHLRLAAALVM